MGNHQSRSVSEHDLAHVVINPQPGKRSSVNIFKKVDPRHGSLSRLGRVQSSLTKRHFSATPPPFAQSGYGPTQRKQPMSRKGSHESTALGSGMELIRVDTGTEPFTNMTLPEGQISGSEEGLPTSLIHNNEGPSVYEVKSDQENTRLVSPRDSSAQGTPEVRTTSLELVTDDDSIDADNTVRTRHRRAKTTGPELFKVTENDPPRLQAMPSLSAPNLLMADFPNPNISLVYDSPEKPYRPTSKLAPPQFFFQAKRVPHPHAPRMIKSLDPRVQRLVQQRYPLNLIRESDPFGSQHSDIALAMPLTRAQAECHDQHKRWLSSDNTISPVECAVCLGPRDLTQDSVAGMYWMCEHCAVRICTGCKRACEEDGKLGMMKRYDDGSTSQSDNAVVDENMPPEVE